MGMKIISVDALTEIVKKHGFNNYIQDLMTGLKRDFSRWEHFNKMPRPAMHVPDGVLELMPVCDDEYYSFKYVNCHPKNPNVGKQTVVATGQLSRVDTGYPVMFSEMTVLTALRTAAVSALATDLMAREDSEVFAIIGTGAQSEFQVKANALVRNIKEVRYFDTDPKAMDKFEKNMGESPIKLTRCESAEEAVSGSDVIIVCTACKEHVDVVMDDWVKPGMHINALGGDCPGKTELELPLLSRSRIVVEYFDQSFIEGEIQRYTEEEARKAVDAEFYEVITGAKKGRESDDEITLFDSVGIGLEDYSALRMTYELAEKHGFGETRTLIPDITDPKDLLSVIE